MRSIAALCLGALNRPRKGAVQRGPRFSYGGWVGAGRSEGSPVSPNRGTLADGIGYLGETMLVYL